MIRVWVRIDSTNQPVWNRAALIPAVKEVEHHKKGRVIKDGTARPNKQDEPVKFRHGPGLGLGDLLRVHVIQRNGNLGKVIEQIVGQDLNRGHGNEGQEGAGAHHAEHIAEGGTGPHADVLEDVGKNLPPFNYPPRPAPSGFFRVKSGLPFPWQYLPPSPPRSPRQQCVKPARH